MSGGRFSLLTLQNIAAGNNNNLSLKWLWTGTTRRVWVPIIQKAKSKGEEDEVIDYVLANLER